MIFVRTALLSLRMLSRSPLRAVLAVLGIAVAVLLLCAERAMHEGVTEATSANERDTRLIVYRANRFCPFTSRIPERYTDDIMRIPGVKSAIPMQIVVSNCRASLDVIVFRGVRAADAERLPLGWILQTVRFGVAARVHRADIRIEKNPTTSPKDVHKRNA